MQTTAKTSLSPRRMLVRRPWWRGLVPLCCALLTLATVVGSVRSQKGEDKEKAPNLGANRDVPIVERLLAARREYQLTLETLRKHYLAIGDIQKARWAEEELMQYHRMLKHAFVMPMELPPPTLKGQQNVPEANKLYRQGMAFKDKGWGTDYVDNQRRAEILFQKILTEYPQSDKISDVAYQLGDLYESRAYNQYYRAAGYFERCYEWNQKTQYDARMRAARLYERQLNDRGKATTIYKEIILRETDERRIEEARRRLQELSSRR